jgi:predicted MFS family arabinose efflux permease
LNTHPIPQTLSKPLLWLMAITAGLGIANLYYNQPLLDQMRMDLSVGTRAIGAIPTATQVGYAIGMLFLVPLGDMLQRKRLVLLFTTLSALAATGIALAPSFGALVAGSFLFGLTTMTPQLLVPLAAQLAPVERKGKVVGFMVSGILLGILLARTFSGFVGAAFGWRTAFALAAGVQATMIVVLAFALPRTTPTYRGHYLGLLATVWHLMRDQPVLREAALFGAMLFGSFMVFWSNLIHLMQGPAFGLGPRAVGLYGLLGALAALLCPWAGSQADRADPRRVTGLMIAIAAASYAVFYVGRASLTVIGLGVLIMDVGVQLGHVTNQGRIFRLVPSAQSRLQTAYMFCYFVGGGLGSWLGALAWSHFGWAGVCGAATGMLAVAAIRYLLPAPR